jgi:non-specific serine/threonine protein kinase
MQLEGCFTLLAGSGRTASTRHQTLRTAFDWSCELLPETERAFLRRLAVFTTGFTLEASTAVMNDPGITTQVVLDDIASLVAKSLVAPDRSGSAGR